MYQLTSWNNQRKLASILDHNEYGMVMHPPSFSWPGHVFPDAQSWHRSGSRLQSTINHQRISGYYVGFSIRSGRLDILAVQQTKIAVSAVDYFFVLETYPRHTCRYAWTRVGCSDGGTTMGLDMSHMNLCKLPDSIWQLPHLRTLDLTHNRLVVLPDSISRAAQLEHLDLANNQLRELPDCIGQLTQLRSLNLAGNRLTTLPDSIGQLTRLEHLDLAGNRLTALPDSIGQLTRLEHLDLAGNRLTTLPDSIGQLTQLQDLILNDNQLTALPLSLRALRALMQLYLHGNARLGLPPEVLGPRWYQVLNPTLGVAPAKPLEILRHYF
jgi:hypothetical protein